MASKEGRKVARRVLGYIEAFPEQHNQDVFVEADVDTPTKNICSSAMCVAGTAVYLADGAKGIHKIFKDSDKHGSDVDVSFENRATELLGLTGEEANALFFTFNNKAAKRMLKAYVKGDMDKFWRLHDKYRYQ